MPLPETSRFELTSNFTICRILNGMWQVSGAHGYIEPKRAVEEMFTYHDAGPTRGLFRRVEWMGIGERDWLAERTGLELSLHFWNFLMSNA
jgi:hypothetical protein